MAPNYVFSEISEITARLMTNKIKRKQKKIFQNWFSTEFTIVTSCNSKKKSYLSSHSGLSHSGGPAKNLLMLTFGKMNALLAKELIFK